MITKEDFVDLLNESYPAVRLGRRLEYGYGTALRALDPVQFDIEYHDYLQQIEDACEAE